MVLRWPGWSAIGIGSTPSIFSAYGMDLRITDVLAPNAPLTSLQEWIDDLNMGGLMKLQSLIQEVTKDKLQNPRILSRFIHLRISIWAPKVAKLRKHRGQASRCRHERHKNTYLVAYHLLDLRYRCGRQGKPIATTQKNSSP